MPTEQLDEEAVFKFACQLATPQARATYLQQVCSGDQALLDRVSGCQTGTSTWESRPCQVEVACLRGFLCEASNPVHPRAFQRQVLLLGRVP